MLHTAHYRTLVLPVTVNILQRHRLSEAHSRSCATTLPRTSSDGSTQSLFALPQIRKIPLKSAQEKKKQTNQKNTQNPCYWPLFALTARMIPGMTLIRNCAMCISRYSLVKHSFGVRDTDLLMQELLGGFLTHPGNQKSP